MVRGYLVFIVVIDTYDCSQLLRLASYTYIRYMEEPILITAKVTDGIIMKPPFKMLFYNANLSL